MTNPPFLSRDLLNRVQNGVCPSFSELAAYSISGLDAWLFRAACFGDINAAIQFAANLGFKWSLSYDNRAVIHLPKTDISVISVTPSHSLICATIQALIHESK